MERLSLSSKSPPCWNCDHQKHKLLCPLFCCDTTAGDTDSLLLKWFGSYSHWHSIVETIIIARLGYLTPSNRFILLVNALEMIYSELFDSKQSKEAKNLHKQMVKKIPQCVETEMSKKACKR